jgi:hypothetical protein
MMSQVRIFSELHNGYWRPNRQGYTPHKSDAWVLPEDRAKREIANLSVHLPRLEPVNPGDTPLKFAVGTKVIVTAMMHPWTGHTGVVERITVDRLGVRYYVKGDSWGTEATERELKEA